MHPRRLLLPVAIASVLSLGLFGCNDNDSNTNTTTDSGTSDKATEGNFNRIATFAACSALDINCDTDEETVAEIAAATADGMYVIYTDSPQNKVSLVDISNAASPAFVSSMSLNGEPTSVAISGSYALVGVNTSVDFVNVSGELAVLNATSLAPVATIDLGGQPDSVAVSKDGKYAVIAMENERDEGIEVGGVEGGLPQQPAGYVVIVTMTGEPASWTTKVVDMTGLNGALYPTDPEPEYVDINDDNVAVVTLQENNAIALVDLATATVTKSFSAGSVDLSEIDTEEEDPALISLTGSQTAQLREPDGVTWIDTEHFITANEGDLDGGSRGFTVFNTDGDVVFESANKLDHLTVQHGTYPDGRSGNKGNEPENAEYGEFMGNKFAIIASERASVLFVYDVSNPANPALHQVLPAAAGPEGVLAIPSRNLLVASSEVDARGDNLRAGLNIYEFSEADASYPTLVSENRTDGTPIPWSALSGLAADSTDANTLYTVQDSFFQQSRILKMDISAKPAKINEEIVLKDTNDVLASVTVATLADATVADDDATRIDVFDEADLGAMINTDKTVNLDLEGIAVATDGGFWLASEGAGTVGDSARPVNSLDLLIKASATGVIEQVVLLPDPVNAQQVRFGFEGVAQEGDKVYVAFQRAWGSEANPRIGIYDTTNASWSFVYYPLDAVESQAGGWVGLSDLTSLGNGQFMVVERDNKFGPDAAIKRLYKIDLTGVTEGAVLTKTLIRDLMPDLKAMGGLVAEKIEGATATANGNVLIVNDNDGVDDNSGETELLNLGQIL